MNRRAGCLIFLALASAFPLRAQRDTVAPARDTAVMNRIILLDPGVSLGRPVFLFPASVGSGIDLRTRFMMSPDDGYIPGRPFVYGLLEPRQDLIAPLRLQMMKEKAVSPFFQVLGAMEFGAVGIMAIHHVKKYGLFR